MVLHALTVYYETLLAQGHLSPPGWDDNFKVSFGLDLAPDGTIRELISFKEQVQRGKKTVFLPKTMCVPAHAKRTSGVTPSFLCDNSSYILGADAKGKPDRSRDCFAANRILHKQVLTGLKSEAANAILNFYDRWDTFSSSKHPLLADNWAEISSGANLIFCFEGIPVTNDPAICEAWSNYFNTPPPDALFAQCLVTGKQAPIAIIHPSIKGIRDAQPAGASLVSFNGPAFEAFGHKQGMNAPVSDYAAFAYTAALNYLIADAEHRFILGDTNVLFWSESGEDQYRDFMTQALSGRRVDGEIDDFLTSFEALANGICCSWNQRFLDPDTQFYILGISPNAARLSVRFFLQDSFGHFMRNLMQHFEDTAIIRPIFDPYEKLPIVKFLDEAVNPNLSNSVACPKLAGDVLRSILTNTPYPFTLFISILHRIRTENNLTRGRAAILKGYFLRTLRQGISTPTFPKEEALQMELNEKCSDIPYTLGRLLSVYEQIQQFANPGIKFTVKDKYFINAFASPAAIFPTLGSLTQTNLRILRRTKPGLAVNFDKKIGELSLIIGDRFPDRLDLSQQGSFQLGYYFENQARYQKKESPQNA